MHFIGELEMTENLDTSCRRGVKRQIVDDFERMDCCRVGVWVDALASKSLRRNTTSVQQDVLCLSVPFGIPTA